MRRLVPSIVSLGSVLLLAACTDTPQPTAPGDARRDGLEEPAAEGRLGDPLPGLTEDELFLFKRGKYLFRVQFTQQEGLGPTFNSRSCAACHDDDGGADSVFGGASARLETHFTRLNADGSCSSLATRGGVVKQDSATTLLKQQTNFAFTTEPFPTGAHDTAQRITPDLFGFGLIASIPEAAILALADPSDADGDGISGRAHIVGGVAGRFGRKAAGNDLDQFVAGAFLNEMGITNHLFPDENLVGSDSIGGAAIPDSVDPVATLEVGADSLAKVTAFVRFLAPPPSLPHDSAGEALFNSTGCGKCHTPQEYTTVSSLSPALDGKQVRPFSDFLLHDMGPQLSPHLGDICQVHAGRTEFRTEPLMGARFTSFFMHDGLATSVDQAILQHGGEAGAARSAYSSLPGAQRQALVDYIMTL